MAIERSQIAKTLCYALSAGRDESHGASHSEAVVFNAHRYSKGYWVDAEDVAVVAWLHDVADHKYDTDGELARQVKKCLKVLYPEAHETVWRVICSISYSKERSLGLDALHEGINEYWWNIRNIVSDADKIEALGQTGVVRCLEYSRAANPCASDEDIHAMLLAHVEEKLGTLHQYFRTPLGRVEAQHATEEMRNVA